MSIITNDNYDEFKREYEFAMAEHRDGFMFESQIVMCDYAKYLIQYAEGSE